MRSAYSILAALFVATSVCVAAGRVVGSAEAVGRASVVQVVASSSTDLVVLASGYNQGFRPGNVCTVTRSGRALGSVVVAESTEQRAVALILSLDDNARIAAGDVVNLRANPRL